MALLFLRGCSFPSVFFPLRRFYGHHPDTTCPDRADLPSVTQHKAYKQIYVLELKRVNLQPTQRASISLPFMKAVLLLCCTADMLLTHTAMGHLHKKSVSSQDKCMGQIKKRASLQLIIHDTYCTLQMLYWVQQFYYEYLEPDSHHEGKLLFIYVDESGLSFLFDFPGAGPSFLTCLQSDCFHPLSFFI